MNEQFFGKVFFIALGCHALSFLLAILVFKTSFVLPLLLLIITAVFSLSLKRLDWGMGLAFGELFGNSHGHLLSADVGEFSFSLRMAVFLAVMGAWFCLFVTKRVRLSLRDIRLLPFFLLTIAVAQGCLIGFIHQAAGKVFNDANAYFYLAYLLPIISIEWDNAKRRFLLQVFAASAAWVGLVTLGLLYIFSHFPEWVLGPVYTFIRDTRTGELTKQTGNLFRVFLQSQFSVVVYFFVLVAFIWKQGMNFLRKEKGGSVCFSLAIAVILISLSRSFWLGIVAGLLAFLIGIIVYEWRGWKHLGNVSGVGITGLLVAIIFLVGIIVFPYPYRIGSTDALSHLFAKRTTETSDVAVSSRWNLLPPMLEALKQEPILGHGFGKEISFISDDPRVRAASSDGLRYTYAVEWGWLEIPVKMGILGLVAFGWIFLSSVQSLKRYLKTPQSWIALAFIPTLVMLYATHTLSPYLNHPIGLGFLLFLIPFYKKIDSKPVSVPVFVTPNVSLPKSPIIQPTMRTE